MPYLNPVLGAFLLLFGRRLYWAFVAIAGFLVGAQLVNEFLTAPTDGTRLFVALVAGVIGACLAMLAQRVAFVAGGLFAGGYLGVALAGELSASGPPVLWLIGGGLLGAFAAAALMDWAIVVLSSLAGAWAIVAALGLEGVRAGWLLVVIAAIGVMFQGRSLGDRADR